MHVHVDDEEKDEKKALFLMMALLFKGDPAENLLTIYQECQVGVFTHMHCIVSSVICHSYLDCG
jgi:hypothetical protein